MSSSRPFVAIVDGGGANIASLQYALDRLGAVSELTSDAATIRSASHVILPGVGAAAAAMAKLKAAHLDSVVSELRQPLLGICLGLQLLSSGSDESDTPCIGLFPERALRLDGGPDNPVPNMGWCQITRIGDHPILDGIGSGSWFYFVHSYALPVGESTIASADHGGPFAAVIAKDNVCAAQFHPERSAAAGASLLKNFLAMSA